MRWAARFCEGCRWAREWRYKRRVQKKEPGRLVWLGGGDRIWARRRGMYAHGRDREQCGGKAIGWMGVGSTARESRHGRGGWDAGVSWAEEGVASSIKCGRGRPAVPPTHQGREGGGHGHAVGEAVQWALRSMTKWMLCVG